MEIETKDIVSFLTQKNLQVLVYFQRQSSRTLRSSVAQSTQAESLIYCLLGTKKIDVKDIASHVHTIDQLSQQN